MNVLIRWVQKYEQSGLTLVANKIVLGLVRHLLTVGGGFFINQGVMDKNEQETAIAAVITLIGVAWSVMVKMSAKQAADAGQKAAMVMMVLLLLTCLMVSGCATTPNDVALARVAADTAMGYYNQPNTAPTMELEGTNLEWSIKGATKITLLCPLPSKSIYPRDQGTLQTLLNGAGEIAKTAAMGVVGYQGVKALQATATKAPTVVTTEKLVPIEGAVP